MRQQARVGSGRVPAGTRRVLVTALALCLPLPALAEVQITHSGVDCVVAGQFPVIEVVLQPPGEVARARVYFHGRGTGAGGAAGISTGVLLGIGAAAGAAGIAVVVTGGGGDSGSEPGGNPPGGTPPEQTPEPTPTPTPAPDVTGRWAGTFDENPSATRCTVETDLSLDLQQNGDAVSGTFQLRIRAATSAPGDPCPVQPGDVLNGPASGSVNGDTIVLELQIPGGGPALVLPGTISDDRMGGTDPGGGGSWEVRRQP